MSENDEQHETQPIGRDGAATSPPAAGSLPTAPPVAEPAPAAALPPAPSSAPAAEGTAAATPAPAPVARRGFRERFATLRRSDGDRTFGLAALIASALAGFIVGGLGFAAAHAITDDGDHDRGGWMMQRRDGDDEGFGGELGGRGGMHGGPPGAPGQLPPTTPPDDEDSSNG